jgi:F-type H+-transporting ATPase subunit gamma
MSERLADVAAQIASVRQLESVVTAIRGVAASRAQQSRSLLPGIQAYSGVVSQAIGTALDLLPENEVVRSTSRPSRRGIILFCAEQGFASAFSERVFEAAGRELGTAVVFLIGTRGTALAAQRGIPSAWSAAMASNVRAIPALASRIADALYNRVAIGAVEVVDLVCPRAVVGGIRIDRHSLLPLDLRRFEPANSAILPLTTMPPDMLLERLAEEYVYAQLCEAATLAAEAENEARMLAMTAARNNIEHKLDALTTRERQLRQEEITAEIVELAAGTEASKGQIRGTW